MIEKIITEAKVLLYEMQVKAYFDRKYDLVSVIVLDKTMKKCWWLSKDKKIQVFLNFIAARVRSKNISIKVIDDFSKSHKENLWEIDDKYYQTQTFFAYICINYPTEHYTEGEFSVYVYNC